MENNQILALDLGGTKFAYARFDREGSILAQGVVLLAGRSGRQVGTLIEDTVIDQIAEVQAGGGSIGMIGVAVPGIYYANTGHVWAPNIAGWDQYPLRDEMLQYLHDEQITLKIDSDRACYILGEYWKGVAAGCSHAIYLAVGTGIGAGILIDGQVLRGSQDIAGAIGWMSLEGDFIEPYSTFGCFEYNASGQGIALQARGTYEDTAVVIQAYERKEKMAVDLIENAILRWGQASANLVSLFNPEMIIFGGGVFGPAARYIDRIYAEACRWAQPISIKQVKFVPSALGENVALYGAAYLALKDQSFI